MKIQIISDIHLERRPLDYKDILDTNINSNVLVLAGDIGCPRSPIYENFLTWCTVYFNNVIVICGNHEYRTCMPKTFEEVDNIVKSITININAKLPAPKIHFLQSGESIIIDDIIFIGATLWSKIPDCVSKDHIEQINSSFNGMMIQKDVNFTVSNMNKLFQFHLQNIEKSILQGIENKLKNVVITHHAPVLKTMYKVEDYPKNYLYGTDLEKYIKYDIINTWIYGHTHWNVIHNINGTMLVTNQYGNNEKPCRGWNSSFFINI